MIPPRNDRLHPCDQYGLPVGYPSHRRNAVSGTSLRDIGHVQIPAVFSKFHGFTPKSLQIQVSQTISVIPLRQMGLRYRHSGLKTWLLFRGHSLFIIMPNDQKIQRTVIISHLHKGSFRRTILDYMIKPQMIKRKSMSIETSVRVKSMMRFL